MRIILNILGALHKYINKAMKHIKLNKLENMKPYTFDCRLRTVELLPRNDF